MKLFYLRLVLILSLGILTNQTYAQLIQVQSSSAPLTTNPLECQDIIYKVDLYLGCINYTYSSSSFTVSGSTITINVDYSAPSICLGAISYPSHNINIGKISAGTYSVVINGLLNAVATHNINQSITIGSCCGPTANFNPGSAAYCIGDTITLTNNSSAYKSQQWFLGSTLLDSSKHLIHVASQSGNINYTLVAIDSCGTDTIIKPVKVLSDLSLGNDTSICLNDQITKVADLGWSSYNWSTTNQTRIQRISSTGNYILTVTAASGCIQTDSVNVNVVGPLLDLGPDKIICPNGTVSLTAGANLWNTILWNNNDTTSSITVNSPGTYVANVYNSIGCNYVDAVTITLDKDSILTISGGDTICIGDSVQLSTTTNFKSYLWNTGDTISQISTKNKGMYSLSVTTNAGCSIYDTTYVGHNQNPTISLGNDTVICIGKNWLIDASRPGIIGFRWQDASRKNTFNITRKGKYFVAVTDTNGCLGSDTINVDYKDCTPTDPGDTTTNTGINELLKTAHIAIFPNPAKDVVTVKLDNQLNIFSATLIDINGHVVLNHSGLKEQEITIDVSEQSKGTYFLMVETEHEILRSILVIQ